MNASSTTRLHFPWRKKQLLQNNVRCHNRRYRCRVESLEQRTLLAANPLLDQFNVAETFPFESGAPAITVLNDAGDFAVAWESFEGVGDPQGFGLLLNVFDATGSPYLAEPIVVNESIEGDQAAPAMASDGTGQFLVSWQSKTAAGNQDVLGRWYQLDSGQLTAGDEFAIASSPANELAPAVSMQGGAASIVWQTDEAGDYDIVGTQLDYGETTVTTVSVVIDEPGDQIAPDVAVSSNGTDAVVVWQGLTSLDVEADFDIFAQRYDESGPLGSPLAVNESLTLRDQVTPRVEIDGQGDFVVAWMAEGIPGSGSDVFARQYFNGSGFENEFPVNTITRSNQRNPDVGMDDAGNFVITWQSVHQDGFSWGVFATSYDAEGTPIRPDFLVNTGRVKAPQTNPAIDVDPATGDTVIVWLGKDDSHEPSVHGHLYQLDDETGALTETTEEVQLGNYFEIEESPAAAVADSAGNFLVTWQSFDQDGSGLGVYANLLDSYGEPYLTEPILVNEGLTLGNQSAPVVAYQPGSTLTSSDTSAVIVWQSDNLETGGHDLYAQLYGQNLNPVGEPILVNLEGIGGRLPSVGMDADGNFIVVWQTEENDANGSEIYGRYYDVSAGEWSGNPQPINTQTELDQTSPQVAMNSFGEYVVTWVSSHPAATEPEVDPEKSVFLRWYNENGDAVGSEVIAHEYVKDAQEHPDVAINDAGDVVVVWQSINQEADLPGGPDSDHGDGGGHDEGMGVSWGVYARQFLPNRQPLYAEEMLVNATIIGPQRYPGVGIAENGDFTVAWSSNSHDVAGQSWDVYIRQYDDSGEPLRGEELVNTWGTGPQINPAVAENDHGDFGVFWTGIGLAHIEGVHGRIYYADLPDPLTNPSRIPFCDQFLVDETFAVEGSPPGVAMLNDDGDFANTWASLGEEEDPNGFGVYLNAYDDQGSPIGEPILVNQTSLGDQLNSTVATDGYGHAIVVWQSSDEDGARVYGRWFEYDAVAGFTALTDEFPLDAEFDTGEQFVPDVSMSQTEEAFALVVWAGNGLGDLDVYGMELPLPQEGEEYELTVPEFEPINETTDGDQTSPAVSIAPNGETLIIVWQGPGLVEPEPVTIEGEEDDVEEPTIDIFSRVFDGEELLPEETVNTILEHDQVNPDVAAASGGAYTVVWVSEGQVESGSDIYARRFNSEGVGSGDELVNQDPLTRPQRSPAVAMDDSANVSVSWQAVHSDQFSWGIFGREFDPVENGWRDAFQVNEYFTGPQTNPAMATTPDGLTTVAWVGPTTTHAFAVHAQLFQLEAGAVDTRITEDDLVLDTLIEPESTPPAAGMDASGQSVVIWQSYAEDGDGAGIFGQLIGSDGSHIGDRFPVNTITAGNQTNPAVAVAEDGVSVVVWESEVEDDGNTFTKLFARRFYANGTPIDEEEFPVALNEPGDQAEPDVVIGENHEFVVVWQGYAEEGREDTDIVARAFDELGLPSSEPMIINEFTELDQFGPAAAINDAGEVVVAWVSDHPAADPESGDTEKSVFVQMFAGDEPTTPETLVHRYVKDAQEHPDVAIDEDGNFVVVWQSINQDGNTWGVFVRQYNAEKEPLLPREVAVNETREGPQRYASVGMSEDGSFVVTWQGMNQHETISSWDVFQRQYTADGRPEGGEILVNEQWTLGPQIQPVVAQGPNAAFGIYWNGQGVDHYEGVHGRLYVAAPVLLTLENNSPDIGYALAGQSVKVTGTLSAVPTCGETTLTLDWGDGTLEAVEYTLDEEGYGTFLATHRYARGGFYDIEGSLQNSAQEQYRHQLRTRAVVGGPNHQDGVLRVVGTDDLDYLNIEREGSSRLVVRYNFNNNRFIGEYRVNRADVESIEIFMGGGEDHVHLGSGFALPTIIDTGEGISHVNAGDGDDLILGGNSTDYILSEGGNDFIMSYGGTDHINTGTGDDVIYAGSGNDLINSGPGDDLILGEDGEDHINAEAGRDILIGGYGTDRMEGSSDDDILIGGTTDYDNNLKALLAIQDEWLSERSFGVRRDNLYDGTGSADRLNQHFFINEKTVNSDHVRNYLSGGSGLNWIVDFQVMAGVTPFQNRFHPMDVDNNSSVTLIDALEIVSDLRSNGIRDLKGTEFESLGKYVDVNGDWMVTLADALEIVGELRNQLAGIGEPELEALVQNEVTELLAEAEPSPLPALDDDYRDKLMASLVSQSEEAKDASDLMDWLGSELDPDLIEAIAAED